MGYSKITSVEVTNFMVYSRAKLVFDESNIVSIKGYNSAGKSTMLKAIGVCLTNMFPKSQTKLIKHGEDYFRVVVNFDDGVSILRDKYANGQSLYEMYKNGECIFTTKEGRKLSKVDDVPEIIKTYLGLCNTSYGCLNYQSRQDKLWLVETTGSENYSTLNEILKSEEISRANALINSDKNKLSAEITEIEASVQAVKLERLSAEAYTQELLDALEAKEAYSKELMRRYTDAKRLMGTVEDIQGIVVPPVVEKVEYDRLMSMLLVLDMSEEMTGIRVLPEVKKVSNERLERVSALSKAVQDVSSMRSGLVSAEISPVSVDKAGMLGNIAKAMSAYSKAYSEYSDLISRMGEVRKRLDSEVAKAEAEGIHFVKCDNCGSYTEVTEGVSA